MYIYREREREIYMYICIHMYIYIYIYVQPRNSFRLGVARHDRLICHNHKAYERLKWDDIPLSGDCSPDRGLGPSGAQMLNNLRLLPTALLSHRSSEKA